MDTTLRPATHKDFEFVFNLNKINMKKYVDQIRGWNDDYERDAMKSKFTPGIDKIIQTDGQNVGILRVLERPDHFKIDHIELLPQFQNLGIGTRLIYDIITKAKEKNKPVLIQVLKINPALKLYERLGFKKIDEKELKIQLRFN